MKQKILIFFIFLFYPFVCFGEKVEVEFNYSDEFDSINFYMDEVICCSALKKDMKRVGGDYTFECLSDDIPIGWHLFTMTSVFGGKESYHSPGFEWLKKRKEEKSLNFMTITIGDQSIKIQGID